MTTITIAHVTFSMAYVAVIVQSRVSQLDPSLEEAALGVGADEREGAAQLDALRAVLGDMAPDNPMVAVVSDDDE